MPRFVLLRHETPPDFVRQSHWDFLCERGDALAAWALTELPTVWAECLAMPSPPLPSDSVAALELPPHRLAYLEYEGPLSDRRGRVTRTDFGAFAIIAWSHDEVHVELEGQRLSGQAHLNRIFEGDNMTWRLRTTPKQSSR